MKSYRQSLLGFERLLEENSDTVAHNTAVDDVNKDENSENDLFMSATSFLIDKSARYSLKNYIPPLLESIHLFLPYKMFLIEILMNAFRE